MTKEYYKRKQIYKVALYFSVLLFIAFTVTSCGKLNQKTANEIFLNKNANYEIISSETGEGWDGVAYHQFLFRKPGDTKIYKEIWCFVQQDDGTWKVTDQWIPKE